MVASCWFFLWNVYYDARILAAGSSNGVTNTRCCRYSRLCSWWWVEVPPETCRAVSRYNKLCNIASCWIYIRIFTMHGPMNVQWRICLTLNAVPYCINTHIKNWQNNKFKYYCFEQQSKRLADITNTKFCKHSVQHTLC